MKTNLLKGYILGFSMVGVAVIFTLVFDLTIRQATALGAGMIMGGLLAIAFGLKDPK